jgi:hypothetical protein
VTRRVKWIASVGLVVALGVGTAAGIATSAAAKPRPVHTTVVTAPVTTASFSFTATVSGIGKNLGAITVNGSGQADLVNDAVSLSVTLPGAVAQLIPGGSATPEVVNVVLSGGTVYVEVPSLATLLHAPWISLALPAGANGAIPGIFTKVGGALGDVNEILAYARSHHASVHSLGSSVVDSTSVTGSRVNAHVKRLNIVATLWADASDRLVQASVAATTHRGLGISAVVNFTGCDAPVTITTPPPSQVRAIPLSVVTSVLGGFLPHIKLGKHGGLKI